MIGYIKGIFSSIFGKKPAPKAKDIVVLDNDKKNPVVATLPSVMIDKENDGSTRYPDFSYLYDNCVVSSSKELDSVVTKIKANMDKYTSVQTATGVPWTLIAALHYRESGMDFKTYLGNGEPLSRVTRLVPKGRGPFKTWEEGAIDALKYDKLDKKIINTTALMCAQAEIFNGLGYRNKGIYSPYVWSGTNWYANGKYTSDGVYNPFKKDSQIGVAAILKRLENA